MADVKLERTLAALPPDLREEVEDFAAFLLSRRVASKSDLTGEAHPLVGLAGAWRNEPLADKDLLPSRSLGRDVSNKDAQRVYEASGWERDEVFYTYRLDL